MFDDLQAEENASDSNHQYLNESFTFPAQSKEVPSPPSHTDWHTRIRFDEQTRVSSHASSAFSDLEQMSFLLSIFDNIVGPRIVHYWSIESSFDGEKANQNKERPANTNLTVDEEQLLKYIAIHTLNGELYQDKLNYQQKYRLYMINEIDCAIFSVFFDASTLSTFSCSDLIDKYDFSNPNSADLTHTAKQENGNCNKPKTKSTCLNCFSLIVPMQRKDILLGKYGGNDNTRFLISYFENMIIEYKVFAHVKAKAEQSGVSLAIEQDLTKAIRTFCAQLETLAVRGICNSNGRSIGLHGNLRLGVQQDWHIKINMADTFLNDFNFASMTHSMNNDFLVNAITSHVITNHNTIVIGKTSSTINKMINTLALFTPKEKLRVSCLALEESAMLSPYFHLQGFVTETPEDLSGIFDADFIFRKPSPTTIIDLSIKCVYRTSILHDFFHQREKFTKNKVQFLYNSLSHQDLNILFPLNHYVHNVSNTSIVIKSTLITGLLKQTNMLDCEWGIKESFLDLVQKEISLAALSLIEYVNNEMVASMYKKEKQVRLGVKKVCKELDIKSDEDLMVLVAHANYLKPDFSSNLIFV